MPHNPGDVGLGASGFLAPQDHRFKDLLVAVKTELDAAVNTATAAAKRVKLDADLNARGRNRRLEELSRATTKRIREIIERREKALNEQLERLQTDGSSDRITLKDVVGTDALERGSRLFQLDLADQIRRARDVIETADPVELVEMMRRDDAGLLLYAFDSQTFGRREDISTEQLNEARRRWRRARHPEMVSEAEAIESALLSLRGAEGICWEFLTSTTGLQPALIDDEVKRRASSGPVSAEQDAA